MNDNMDKKIDLKRRSNDQGEKSSKADTDTDQLADQLKAATLEDSRTEKL